MVGQHSGAGFFRLAPGNRDGRADHNGCKILMVKLFSDFFFQVGFISLTKDLGVVCYFIYEDFLLL